MTGEADMSQGGDSLHSWRLKIQAAQRERVELESNRMEAGRKLVMLILDAQNHGAKLADIIQWTGLSQPRIYSLIQQFLTREEIQDYRERRKKNQ